MTKVSGSESCHTDRLKFHDDAQGKAGREREKKSLLFSKIVKFTTMRWSEFRLCGVCSFEY